MKKLISKYWLVLLAFVSMSMFTACSSDDDDAVTPVFPEVQAISGSAGEVKEFTFEANENWSLSSNKIWCKIAKSDAEDDVKNEFVVNGTAGKQTIKVTLTDDEPSKDMSVAQLNLKMGGQEVAIAEIHRSADGCELRVYDELGNDITETGIVVGYKDLSDNPLFTTFKVKANYRFAVTNTPAWVQLQGGFLVGKPNQEVVSGAAFVENAGMSAMYPIAKEDGYTVTFASEDGKAETTIPVVFNGMPGNTIDITYPTEQTYKWAVWNVSLDGKTYTQNGSSLNGGSTNDFTFSNFLPFTLKTFSDAYVPVVFEKQGSAYVYGNYGAVNFMMGENGNLKVSVNALNTNDQDSREMYVYALPKAVFDAMEDPEMDMIERVMDENTGTMEFYLKSDYDRYFLMHFTQKEEKKNDGGDASVAPIIFNTMTYVNYDVKKDTEGMYSEPASNIGYDGNEIYVVTLSSAAIKNTVNVAINPNITDWAPTSLDDVMILNGWGDEFSWEASSDLDDNLTINIGLPKDPERLPVFVAIKNNGAIAKVVVFDQDYDSYSKKHTSSIRKIRK